MEENKKFRNHFSIVFEQMGTGFWVFVSAFIFEFLSEPEFIAEVSTMETGGIEVIIGAGIIFIVLAILMGIQVIIWSKTYISVQGNALVIEKNTLKKKKNTIGIQNISNINTEQNVFEMLVGTCRVKIDTNSMSTADSTDVEIVLKKADAEQFKAYLQSRVQQECEESGDASEFVNQNASNDVERMLMHGLFSIHPLSVIILIVSVFGIGKSLSAFDGNILSVLSGVLLLIVFVISILKDILDGFIKYYGFSVKRVNNKIYINYGLLKKVNYVIPVEKINGVKLIQTPQARLAGWYTAEIINVGVGDEENEAQSFFMLYEKKAKIEQKMRELLPEFSDCMKVEIPKQPKSVWIVWLLPILGYVCFVVLLLGIGMEFWKEYFFWFVLAAVALLFIGVIELVGRYMTEGCVIGKEILLTVHGSLGREYVFVKYPKIQYIEVKQNVLAKYFKIQKADIYLLASTQNRCQSVPYFEETKVLELKNHLCNR